MNGKMERFERAVVFRTARGYFFFLALVAVVTFAGGLVVGGIGFVKLPIAKPKEPETVAAVAPPEAVTYERVEKWLAEQEDKRKRAVASADNGVAQPTPVYEEPSGGKRPTGPSGADAELQEITRLDGELRALFPSPPYTWDDVYVEECVNRSAYGCLERRRTLKTEGLSRIVRQVVKGLPRKEVVNRLQLLVNVLKDAPVERRGALIVATVDADREINAAYLARVRERDDEVERRQDEYEGRLEAYEEKTQAQAAKKSRQKTWGLYGVGAGLMLLVLVSVFLVHFAMERHLRVLKTLTEAFQRSGLPPPGAADASAAGVPHAGNG